MRKLLFAVSVLVLPAPALARAQDACPAAGRYDLSVSAGSQSVGARLELTCHDRRHWGRVALALGDSLIGAMLQSDRRGDTLEFRMGGGLSGFTLILRGDSVAGQVVAGRPFPFVGVRRSARSNPSLAAHAALAPWSGVAVDPDSGQSYPVAVDRHTLVFSQHGRRLTRQRLMIATRTGSAWAVAPLTAPADPAASERGPQLLPGGRGLVFASTRRLPGDTATPAAFRLWTIERGRDGWAAPVPFRPAAGLTGDAQQPSVTAAGVTYFTAEREGGLGGRDGYRLAPGATEAEPLGSPVSSRGDEHGLWVSPEGDLLLIARGGGPGPSVGGDDLYWSVREGAGWSEPRLLPVPINSFGNEYGASLSPDRRTLWFTSDRFGIARLFRVDLVAHGVVFPGAAGEPSR